MPLKSKKRKEEKEDGAAAAASAAPASKKAKSALPPASTTTSKITEQPLIMFKNSLTVVTGLDGQTLTTVEPRAAPPPEKKKRIGKGKGSKTGGGGANGGGGGNGGGSGGNDGGEPDSRSSSGSGAPRTDAGASKDEDGAEDGKKLTNKERKRLRDKMVRSQYRAAKQPISLAESGGHGQRGSTATAAYAAKKAAAKAAAVEAVAAIKDATVGQAKKEKPPAASDEHLASMPDAIILPKTLRRLIVKREKARLAKEWGQADLLREDLAGHGVVIFDKTKTFRQADRDITGS